MHAIFHIPCKQAYKVIEMLRAWILFSTNCSLYAALSLLRATVQYIKCLWQPISRAPETLLLLPCVCVCLVSFLYAVRSLIVHTPFYRGALLSKFNQVEIIYPLRGKHKVPFHCIGRYNFEYSFQKCIICVCECARQYSTLSNGHGTSKRLSNNNVHIVWIWISDINYLL